MTTALQLLVCPSVPFNLISTNSAIDQAKAEARFTKLIQNLASVGLATEVRTGDNCAVLIFIKAAQEKHLNAEVYRSRVQDWLYGVRTSAPEKDIQKAIHDEPITEAERLRLIYLLITKPQNEGGAGITPKKGEWENVESIFPLHDHAFNKTWIKEWTQKYFLDIRDLSVIRDRFGEKIAFYFAFLQSYLMFLVFPAAFGFSCWVLFGGYSPIYAVVNCLWCVTFVEYWKKQEIDLAVQWGVSGIAKIQHKRTEFKHEGEITDPVTGEPIKTYSPFKRLSRQLLQIPFAVLAASMLGTLICTTFSIEIFISEVYSGPLKSILVFLPTVILSVVMPTLTTLLTGFAARLTDLENYETTDAYESAMVQKIFVLNFITSYLPIFLTAFIYVPFAEKLVPYLDIFSVAVKPFAQNDAQMKAPQVGFEINPNRLKKQVIYFTVTAQVVNLALEVIVPTIKRRAFTKIKQVKAKRSLTAKGQTPSNVGANDLPEEKDFLSRVRNEAELETYDVTGDLREMIVQFGYLSLFSVIWPLTSVSFFINNWIELRSDALKITMGSQRPIPWRADSIGPWLESLGFLTWLGSLTSAAIVYLFHGDANTLGKSEAKGPDGDPHNIRLWALLLTIMLSEHIFLIARWVVRYTLSKVDSPGLQKQRKERFAIRRQYLEEALGQLEAEKFAGPGVATGEKMRLDHESLEGEGAEGSYSPSVMPMLMPSLDAVGAGEDRVTDGKIEAARQSTLQGHCTAGERFWARQQGVAETVEVGCRLIKQGAPGKAAGEKKDD